MDNLKNYVFAPDSSYKWRLEGKETVLGGVIYQIALTSQTWQGIVWEHKVEVYVPGNLNPNATMGLMNTGGNPDAGDRLLGMGMATRVGAPFAVLYNVPNQPLLGGKMEDALIAETFARFLGTGDTTWPLLLPMVKSVVRAMDAIQAFAKQEWKFTVRQFVITGASKRGWTSWLTGASQDRRVKAIAPMVIDTLNLVKQIPYQKASFGSLSFQIADYSGRGLTDMVLRPEAKPLIDIVDPHRHLSKLALPKLILNGANDPYWTTDALRIYWGDLKGEKWVVYTPNAGHDLNEKGRTDGKPGQERTFAVLAAFVRAQSGLGPKMPKLNWKETEKNGGYRLEARANGNLKAWRLWSAEHTKRDFRLIKWTAKELPGSRAPFVLELLRVPETTYKALFLEAEFETGGITHTLCTPIKILGKPVTV
jgi:PhoPQ-activated pathogenicity-related protein